MPPSIVQSAAKVLEIPFFYNVWMRMAEMDKVRSFAVENIDVEGLVVDLGCSTSKILKHIKPVHYLGVDIDYKSIKRAEAEFGATKNRRWIVGDIDNFRLIVSNISTSPRWFILSGLTHHLNDKQVTNLILNILTHFPSASILCIDGVFTQSDSIRTRFLLNNDRGDNVREIGSLNYLVKAIGVSIESNHIKTSYFGITYEINFIKKV